MGFHEHEDYDNYDEFGPEPPEVPDEFRYCANCVFLDRDMKPFPAYPFSVADNPEELRYCTSDSAESGKLVTHDTDASGCRCFEPTQDILAEIADAVSYRESKFSQRTFY